MLDFCDNIIHLYIYIFTNVKYYGLNDNDYTELSAY